MKYKPDGHHANRMQFEGDTSRARSHYFNNATSNLKLLLFNRFNWMNSFIKENSKGEFELFSSLANYFKDNDIIFKKY